MEMASIVKQYYKAFTTKYGDTALPGHKKALDAILRCISGKPAMPNN
jgi:hypothetical protein